MPWEEDYYSYSYVSAAEKRRRAETAAKKLTKDGKAGLQPVRIEGRLIANSFWGKSWCQHMESYSDYRNRLPRGRSYVRNGSVLDLQISAGNVKALVSGSDLYKVSIKIDAVKAAAWKALKARSSGQVGSLFDLLQGKLSAPVMTIMSCRESGLFPKPSEISFSCSCPDAASMCKHIAAVLYGIGARLDEAPELLFRLRGADHRELITEAADSVAVKVTGPTASTIAADSLADVFGIEIDVADVAVPAATDSKATSKKVKSAAGRKPASKSQARPAKKGGATKSTKAAKAKRVSTAALPMVKSTVRTKTRVKAKRKDTASVSRRRIGRP